METKNREQINTFSLRGQEHAQDIEKLIKEKKKLKNHKQLLKDEVLRQRTELNQLERVATQKTEALTSLSDFFKNHTLAKVKKITTRGKTPTDEVSSIQGSGS